MGAAQLRSTRAHVTSTSLPTTPALPRFWPPFYENTLISPSGYVLPSMISLLKLQYFLFFIFKCVLFYWWCKKTKYWYWIQSYMYSLALSSPFMEMSLSKWKAPQICTFQLFLLLTGWILANNWAFLSIGFLTRKNFTY